MIPSVAFNDMIAGVARPTAHSRLSSRPDAALAKTTQDARLAVRVAELVAALYGAVESPAGNVLQAIAELRKELSIYAQPPIQAVIDHGGLQPLVTQLGTSASVLVQLEAAWALTNVASGTSAQVRALLDAGALQAFYKVLSSEGIRDRSELCDQCLWALGNIASDEDVCFRDALLNSGVIGHLAALFETLPTFPWSNSDRMQVLRTLTWLMRNLCMGEPAPPLDEVDCAFDYFAQVLGCTDDEKMLQDALQGECCLLQGGQKRDETAARAMRVLSAGFAPGEVPCAPACHPVLEKIVGCMRNADNQQNALPLSAIRALSILVSCGEAAVIDSVLASGAVKALGTVLDNGHASSEVRCEAGTALAAIASGTTSQAQHLVESPGLWTVLLQRLQKEGAVDAKPQCAATVANIVKHGTVLLASVDSKALLEALAVAIKVETDAAIQCNLLDTVEAVFLHGAAKEQNANHFCVIARDCGLTSQLERIQEFELGGPQHQAVQILETWFQTLEADENRENEPPGRCTPKKQSQGKLGQQFVSSVTMQGSPKHPQAYKFGA